MQHSTPTTFVYIEHILKIKYILILSNFEIQMAWHVSGVWILSFPINFVHLIILNVFVFRQLTRMKNNVNP